MPLTIDFNKILSDLEEAGMELYNSNDEQVKTVALEYYNARKKRLLLVAEKYASTDPNEHVDEQFVLDRLEDEKDLLLSEGESFGVKALKLAEKATNTGIEILTGAITDILNQVTQPASQPNDPTLNMGEVPKEIITTPEKKTT